MLQTSIPTILRIIPSGGKCKKSSNELALRTKIVCIQRLANDATCTCFVNSFPNELFEKTKKWVKDRNDLMHNLLQLEYYENMDAGFEKIASDGKSLLDQSYSSLYSTDEYYSRLQASECAYFTLELEP